MTLPPEKKMSLLHWLMKSRLLFALAKRAQSAYIVVHNGIHSNPDSLRTRRLLSGKTRIGEGTKVDGTAFVSPIGVKIGRNCTIGPEAVILGRSVLEDDVEVARGAVVGCQGLVLKVKKTEIIAVKHTGGVRIEKGARIGEDTCIDRSTFSGRTVIGERTAIGSQVHIAHDAKIGVGCRVDSCAMISGRVRMGDGAVVEKNCSISHLLEIGSNSLVREYAIVTRDVGYGEAVEGRSPGNPAGKVVKDEAQ